MAGALVNARQGARAVATPIGGRATLARSCRERASGRQVVGRAQAVDDDVDGAASPFGEAGDAGAREQCGPEVPDMAGDEALDRGLQVGIGADLAVADAVFEDLAGDLGDWLDVGAVRELGFAVPYTL